MGVGAVAAATARVGSVTAWGVINTRLAAAPKGRSSWTHTNASDTIATVYPLLLDLTRHHCLIVGGGAVATRKAEGLLQAGAEHVAAVATEFAPKFPTTVQRIIAHYNADHLADMTLAFAATNRADVNDQVVRDARARHILVNRADASDEFPGDFTTPAHWRDEPIIVTVSAGSAALSARLRDELRNQWRPIWTKMAKAMETLRPELKTRFDEPTRRKLFRALADESAFAKFEAGGIDALRDEIARQTTL